MDNNKINDLHEERARLIQEKVRIDGVILELIARRDSGARGLDRDIAEHRQASAMVAADIATIKSEIQRAAQDRRKGFATLLSECLAKRAEAHSDPDDPVRLALLEVAAAVMDALKEAR